MEQQTPAFDLRYFINALINGKWIVLATMLVVVTLAIISNYFQVFRYQSGAQIQIDAPPFLPSPGSDPSSQMSYYLNIERYFKTEKEKLNSARMHMLFATGLKEKDPRYRDVSSEAIAGEVAGGLRVEPVEDTNLVSVYLTLLDSQRAAEWLNMYVDMFVDENARVQEEKVNQNREILGRQLDEIRNLISSQQSQMNQYVASVGGTTGAEPTAGEGESVLRYQNAYDEARKKRYEEEQRLKRLEPFLAPGTDLSSISTFEFTPNLRVHFDRLLLVSADLEKLRNEGKGEAHPSVAAKKIEHDTVQEQLRSELKKSVDTLKLNIAVYQKDESTALQAYNQQIAARKTSSRRMEEMSRLAKLRDNWTNASAIVEDKLRSLKVLESFVTNNMTVVERARPSQFPVSQRGKTFVGLIGIGGILLGMGIVIAGEMLNPKVKTVDEIHSSLNVPALGFLPRASDFSLNEIRESYNVLRTELLFRRDMHQHRALMVTSSVPQEGKTTVTVNLAKTLAAAGDRTVVLDFDLRKARLRSMMSTGSQNGSSVFSPVDGLNLRLETTDTRTLHLIVPAALPRHPPFLLSQPEIREMIEMLRSHYDWVLIDTPPVTSVTDPVIIAGLVDTVLFVIKHNFVDKRIVRDSLATLNKANADIMGAVLNDLDVKKMSYYSYQSYYRYYSDSEAK